MKPGRAADLLESGYDEMLNYMDFPREHWRGWAFAKW